MTLADESRATSGPAEFDRTPPQAIEAEQSGDGAEDKIATRRIVDEAKQILMDRDDLPETEAFSFIQRTAMQTRARMRDVAQQVVDGTLTP